MSDDLRKKYTPAYAEYQRYLTEVVFAEEIKELEENKKKETINEIQEILRKSEQKE